uniref:Uncharacterized protein n=1 Tax=Globisporangium ultimum (strain ATCC 200006 / CBS 805.95 / DAOM BR144) TaxID=431595 RepID=K3WTU2_GLOUD
MVNKIKKFFKSIGRPSSSGSASMSSSNTGYPLLASSDNQFHHQYESRSNKVPLASSPSFGLGMETTAMLQATEASGSNSSDGMVSPVRPGSSEVLKWGVLLSKIPKLIAGATTPSSSASSGSPQSEYAGGDGNAEMNMLLELLTQMATREYQAQIAQFYVGEGNAAFAGNPSASSGAPAAMISSWEQRRLFRQCRRALLLCWKFIIAQLNDEKACLTSEMKETQCQLVVLIAERVEFHLTVDMSPATSSTNSRSTQRPTRRENNSGHGMGWTVNSPPASSNSRAHRPTRRENNSGHGMGWTANSPVASNNSETSSAQGMGWTANSPTTSGSNASDYNSGVAGGEEGSDGERDLYLYRCLLVATFKYVIENIESAKLKKRSWITLSETQFFAKVLAVCFFRIPVLQRMIIDQIFFTYRQKKWTNTVAMEQDQSSSSSSMRLQPPGTPNHVASRRRSSSKFGNGLTFASSLNQWSEFEGHVLSELENPDETAYSRTESKSSSENNQNGNHFPSASRAAVDKFKWLNPTLFRWTRYAPYLAPYADNDVFHMNDSTKVSWLEKLSHDGEFFAVFMGYYTQHAETCSVGEMIWSALPGYSLLIRVSLLLLKEASWGKWLYIRDTSNSVVSSMLEPPSSNDDMKTLFELKSIRNIKTVLETVAQLLHNKELLESCTLAMYECTNVFHARSVASTLSRFEEWFNATASLVSNETAQLVHRLPPTFSGQSFAIGIRVMLASESFEILNRVLQFLYNQMDYFDGDLRQNILKVLVQRHMFLFLHWNVDVRSNYHHLLVYKIIRVNRYFLDSPIDHLLIGRYAVSPLDSNGNTPNGFDEQDEHIGTSNGRQYQITAAEFNALRMEQALWRAFDACIGAICVQERKHAKEGNRKYQNEIQCARSRAIAFQKLSRRTVDELNSSSSVNEGLPGGKPWHELDLLDEELHREPPYYLRYLPAEEVSSLDELRRLANTVKHPPELQVYAALSLRHYSDMLKKYYQELSQNRCVEAPPLGYC